jgi:hypothetical protein
MDLLDEAERLYEVRNSIPKWRWIKHWRATNEWLACVGALQNEEISRHEVDIFLPPDHIHVAGHPNSRVRDLHIPLDGTTLAAVEKGILDAEFMGF